MTDTHTHSTYSYDAHVPLSELVEKALKLNLKYLGISEHYDLDAVFYGKGNCRLPDLDKYFSECNKLKEQYASNISLLCGLELGFDKSEKIQNDYKILIEKYRPDYIINSVHLIDGTDYYYHSYGEKVDEYEKYLKKICDSVKAEYYYDIVAHVGYAARYAPYRDKKMSYELFKKYYDDIFEVIIEKNKILEVNSSTKDENLPCYPEKDVLTAYYKKGGRNISFGSDTHTGDRLSDKREKCVTLLKEIGFNYITVPKNREKIKIYI